MPTHDRPYFFWDYDVSEADVRQMLAGDNQYERAWVISRLLGAAHWDDIWRYITLADLRRDFDLLTFRTPYFREAWEHALEVWSRTEGDDQAVRETPAVYQALPAPALQPGILTAGQTAFLERFFASEVGRRFFLTGGTALAAFYLHHRLSDDLDLFTTDGEALDLVESQIAALAADHGWQVSSRRLSPYFLRLMVTIGEEKPLEVEFVRETGPQLGAKLACGGVLVDSLTDLAVNKVTAILGRTEAKDFVDLYFLVRQFDFNIDELITQAQDKDGGLTEFFWGQAARQVHRLTKLPTMLRPVTLAELAAFYDQVADRLLAEHRPPA